jgi:hypothetical protein
MKLGSFDSFAMRDGVEMLIGLCDRFQFILLDHVYLRPLLVTEPGRAFATDTRLAVPCCSDLSFR